jgi:hypothetical protein
MTTTPHCSEHNCNRRVPVEWSADPEGRDVFWQECSRCNDPVCTRHSWLNECGKRICESCHERDCRERAADRESGEKG